MEIQESIGIRQKKYKFCEKRENNVFFYDSVIKQSNLIQFHISHFPGGKKSKPLGPLQGSKMAALIWTMQKVAKKRLLLKEGND